MSNEKIFEQHFAIEESFCNPLGGLKPTEFLFLIQEATLGGSAFVGAGVEKVRSLGLFWVVMSYHFVINRMPHVGERITIKTYPAPAKAFIYPRHYSVVDEEGNTIIRGISLWALLDKATHKPTFPAKNGINPIGLSFPDELPWPPSLALGQVSLKETRLVRYSDLDFNGHMNNVRYLDYALDSEKSTYFDTAVIKELQINFSTETQLGEEMELSTGVEGTNRYYQGRIKGRNVFAIKLVISE
jgi:medium-chain acyl-[acyl-carrier-protein] hydrolase